LSRDRYVEVNKILELSGGKWNRSKKGHVFESEEKAKEMLRDLAIQGELVGESIQSNRLKIKGHKILVFSVYNFKEARYLNLDEMILVINKLEMEMVPLLAVNDVLLDSVDALITFSTRKSAINPETWAEGVVFRSVIEKNDEELGRLSFKALNPEYLLREE
jgi:hypothetical protein